MRNTAEPRATYEDLLQVPGDLVAEIINGRLVTQPRPRPAHAAVASNLGADLVNPFGRGRGGPGGWWILDAPELHLGPDILVPDLAGWRRKRMSSLPEIAWFELAPDWVCEILSPSTCRDDGVVKMPLYARENVGRIWLIDPDQKTLEAYALQDGHWLLLGASKEEESIAIAPFASLELDLSELWP